MLNLDGQVNIRSCGTGGLQPAQEVQLHPATIIYSRLVPPCFIKVNRDLQSCFVRKTRNCCMQWRRALNKVSKDHTGVTAATYLFHFVIEGSESWVTKARSRVIDWWSFAGDFFNLVQHTKNRHDTLTPQNFQLFSKTRQTVHTHLRSNAFLCQLHANYWVIQCFNVRNNVFVSLRCLESVQLFLGKNAFCRLYECHGDM